MSRKPAAVLPALQTEVSSRDGLATGDELSAELVDASTFARLDDRWRSLCERAAVPNAFMDPAFALAVAAEGAERIRVVLAWQAGRNRSEQLLVGAWLVRIGRPRQTWPKRALASPTSPLADLGTPVVDRALVRPALRAMLVAMRDDPHLPDMVQIGNLSACLLPDLSIVLGREGMTLATIETRSRARLLRGPDPNAFWAAAVSKRKRHRLNDFRRTLSRRGSLVTSRFDRPDDVAAALERCLALEASGWKGARDSAIACDPRKAMLTRAFVNGLARRGRVHVHAIHLNDQLLSMSIVALSGSAAFTWKTAYDESYRQFSPGILLLQDLTLSLLANPAIDMTDSCNVADTGYQALRWPDRHELLDVLIDLRQGRRFALRVLSARERAIRRLKGVLRRWFAASWPWDWDRLRPLRGAPPPR